MNEKPNAKNSGFEGNPEWDEFTRFREKVEAQRETLSEAKEQQAVDAEAEADPKKQDLASEKQAELARQKQIELDLHKQEEHDRQARMIKASMIEDQQEAERAAEIQRIMAEEEKANKQKTAEQEKHELEILALVNEYLENEAKLNELNQHETEIAQKAEVKTEKETKIAEEITPEPENPNPLVAIDVDWTHDKREIAHDLAEQTLNNEIANSKGLKETIINVWGKGTLFKKFFTERYTQEYMKGKRKTEDGKTVKDLIMEQKQETIERFTMGVVEEGFVHKKAGESLIPADEKTNESIKAAIEDYARRSLEPGQKVKDLDREFRNEIGRIMQEAIDDGRISKRTHTANYIDTAKEAAFRYQELVIQARSKAEHDAAMAQVMAGFQVYNAEVRSGVRTEAHRDNIDKIVNKIESTKFGQIIPAEILAGAVGVASGLTQTGFRAVFGVAGGILASGAISGLKERNRLTEDRVRMQRDIANGLGYDNSKYEQRIGGTLYDLQPASDLTAKLEAAIEDRGSKGYGFRLMQAMAEARVRIDFSDSEKKDLISYSSPENRGKERLALDKALIMAEKALNDKGKKDYAQIKEIIRDRIIEGYEEDGKHHAGVNEKDKKFARDRAKAAAAKAGKTLALGATIFFGSQELSALIDSNKIGIFEKAGLIHTQNAEDAQETVLASGFSAFRGSYNKITGEATETYKNISDPEQIKKFEAAGYDKTEVSSGFTSHKDEWVDVDPSKSTARVDVQYDGWAHNGTKVADGNELRTSIQNGQFISRMTGNSTYNGQAVTYDPSSVKGYLTLGDAKFEIQGIPDGSGQVIWSNGGVFTTTTGETIKAIGDNGEKLYKYFEVAADNSVQGDAVRHIIPLATDVGTDTFSGKIQQLVSTPIESPAVYNFYKTTPVTETFLRETTVRGLAIAPETARGGLGVLRPVETATSAEPAAETTEPAAETTGAATGNASETAETAPGAASEAEGWNTALLNEINDNSALLGGENGVSIVTDRTPYGEESIARYSNWWNNLAEEGKNFVRNLFNEIDSSNYRYTLNWGSGLHTWLIQNAVA